MANFDGDFELKFEAIKTDADGTEHKAIQIAHVHFNAVNDAITDMQIVKQVSISEIAKPGTFIASFAATDADFDVDSVGADARR